MQDLLPFEESVDLAALVELVPARTLVLTVNNRLARRLTLDLAARFRAERQVSELPRIMPLSAWLADAAQSLTFVSQDAPKFRLNTFASQRLWVDVIEAEEADRALMDVNQAARLAMDADVLMDEWQLAVPDTVATDEFNSFRRWRKRYHARLAQLDAQDANRGYADVLAALAAQRLPLPENIVLAGFSEVSPRFERLRASMTIGKSRVLHFADDQAVLCEPQRYTAADPAGEWLAAAQWARARLSQQPEGRFAIVSSQLEAEAPFARRVLQDTLKTDFAFNVAVGRALQAWPVVQGALAWLQALNALSDSGVCAPEQAGAALLCAHHVGSSSVGALAQADARWRRNELLRVTEAHFSEALSPDPVLLQGWSNAVRIWREPHPRGESADVWATVMRRALSALGFPGKGNDSVTFQVVGAFSELLDTYASLTPVARGLSGGAALALLAQLAQHTPFQPQRDPGARLDVLGMLEAEGGQWDGVWLLGLTDDVLPASPRPNPLIPLVVLRQAGAPRATPDRERTWAQAMFASLRGVAPEVVVSHAHLDGERELRASPLIADYAPRTEGESAVINPGDSRAGDVVQGAALQTLRDEQGPPLADDAVTTGGLDVLDTQARNPMWAFVRHRLGGRALLPYAEPASVNVRGQFLHAALEIAWRTLTGQDALHALVARGALDAFIDECVAQAADPWLQGYAPVLRELELARAHQVLRRWFDVEAQRLPFEVGEVESKIAWRRGPLSLTVRLDRLDVLAQGRLIVDYKTGSAGASFESDWARVRPINLQLPFYAAVIDSGADDLPVGGLVLAQIHARRIVAAGLSDIDTGFVEVRSLRDSRYFEGVTWTDLLGRWRQAIETLADEYASGHAANIVFRASDLKYCDALPFLRLHLDHDD